MSTYYNNGNNNNIQGVASDHGLQTLLLMNPTTPYHSHHHHNLIGSYNSSSNTPQQHHNNNNNNNNNNNLVFVNSLPHANNPLEHHLVGIPLDPRHEISALHHAFMPRVHYMEGPRQQGGLSLTLSGPPVEGTNRVNFGVNVVLGSRYLKAAQELLDEVVSVGNEVVKVKMVGESSTVAGGEGSGGGGGERGGGGGEISAAERQEIQMKKAKLLGMLEEVEQRYRQYNHQMKIVISWFEQATGTGSAKTYTSLALQTISKKSRCLKDAISAQIRASNKSLGEEDSFGSGKNEGGSRLKFVDHQIRQQRALQQLGMIQPNAWRPQRGLPERSVSVLRAWLFEHFLHPYPKDSDKIMLAKQTGLTRSQVSNWFINARVRLWKPMVEEMYMEEIKDHEQNGPGPGPGPGPDERTKKIENDANKDSTSKITVNEEKIPARENQNMNFKSILNIPTNRNSPPVISTSQSPMGTNIINHPKFTLIRSPDTESISQASPKKQRNTEYLQSPSSYLSNEQISMKFGNERENRESFSLMGEPANFIGGFGAFPIGEMGRFGDEQYPGTYSGNGVSLTLGLPHGENLSLTGAHQSFYQNQNIQMGRRLEIGEPDEFSNIDTSTPSHSSIAYESINIQNRKRFAAQLLPDFVT